MSDVFVSLLLLGAVSSSEATLPFWMTANRYGLMPENSGMLAWVEASSPFRDDGKTFQLRWAASLAANSYSNAVLPDEPHFHGMVDELYGSVRWKKFTLDLGQKHRDPDFLGASPALGSLSVTGGHLAETENARALPGYRLWLDPVAIPLTGRHAFLYGAWGDYKTLDDRYVKGALVHKTLVGLRFDAGKRFSFHIMLDHYAMWGGVSSNPQAHNIDVTLPNYLRVVTGSHAGSAGSLGDQINVIGDQGGAELFKAEYRGDGWTLTAQHDIPYSDGSGMGFQNFPDGVNTLYFGWDDKDRWVSDIVFEYHYTRFQSGPLHTEIFDEHGNNLTPPGSKTTGMDNYYNNGEYRSGWTYFGRPMAAPLFFPKGTKDGTWTGAARVLGIESNRYRAHHLGLSGKLFRRHPYKLMLTYSQNYGTYGRPYAGESAAQKIWGTVRETSVNQLSGAFTGLCADLAGLPGLALQYGLYADYGSLLPKSLGLTLGLRYSF